VQYSAPSRVTVQSVPGPIGSLDILDDVAATGHQCLSEQVVEARHLVFGDVAAVIQDEEQWVLQLCLHYALQGLRLTLVGLEYFISITAGTDADVDAIDERCGVVLQPHVQRVAAIDAYLHHGSSTQLSTMVKG